MAEMSSYIEDAVNMYTDTPYIYICPLYIPYIYIKVKGIKGENSLRQLISII